MDTITMVSIFIAYLVFILVMTLPIPIGLQIYMGDKKNSLGLEASVFGIKKPINPFVTKKPKADLPSSTKEKKSEKKYKIGLKAPGSIKLLDVYRYFPQYFKVYSMYPIASAPMAINTLIGVFSSIITIILAQNPYVNTKGLRYNTYNDDSKIYLQINTKFTINIFLAIALATKIIKIERRKI